MTFSRKPYIVISGTLACLMAIATFLWDWSVDQDYDDEIGRSRQTGL